ncbi:MAG TPA: SMP-30/gluconolactonase/LRE family protein [Croceibacterium sp.]|nr:SMP-30/gluconolactonase/LRE family protein [Croceibacterium sp.]
MDPVSVLAVGAMLGEGPVWIGDAVWFVDIKGHKVHRFDPETKAHNAFEAPDQVGWVLPAEGGGLIAGVKTGLHRLDPQTGVFSLLHNPEPQFPNNRLNDATTDVHGRLWFGSMDDGESQKTGYLYRCVNGLCSDSGLPPVAITNGPALNADGTVLYHTDTLGRIIYRVPVNDDGSLGPPVPFVTIEDGGGYPDGPVVDTEGCLWTGLYAGWSVRRYDPAGKLIKTVRLPTANVTKMCFGGPDLKTAYATTARKNLDAAALAAQPDAGNLFAFDPGVAGLPVTPAKITGLAT